jgi:hypothetical protein
LSASRGKGDLSVRWRKGDLSASRRKGDLSASRGKGDLSARSWRKGDLSAIDGEWKRLIVCETIMGGYTHIKLHELPFIYLFVFNS